MTSRQLLRSSILLRSAVLAICAFLSVTALHAEDRKIERKVQPIYPELAKRMHVEGTVKVTATVGPDGSVLSATTVSGNKMLAPAAEDAVKRWKFASGAGQANVDIDINFQLSN